MPRSRATARTMSVPQLGALAHGAQRLHRAFVDGEVGVGNHEFGVHLQPRAEARTLGAHALGRVEREELGRRLGERDAAVVAGPVLRTSSCSGWPSAATMTMPWPCLRAVSTRVGEALLDARLRDQPVDHGFDRVLLLLVEADLVLEREHHAVDASPGEARLAHLVENVAVLALPLLDQRGENQELRARRACRGSRRRSAATTAGRPGLPQLWQVSRPTRAHNTRR